MRRSTFFIIFLTAGIGAALFQLKYEVMSLERQHHKICNRIKESKDTLHVLKAEWTHLNDPQRLQTLVQKHLDIQPVSGKQMVSFDKVNSIKEVYDRKALGQLVENTITPISKNLSKGGEG